MSFLKYSIISIWLLLYSLIVSATVILPNPKIPLDEKMSSEYKKLQVAKDYKKLRELATAQAFLYYDEYVKEFKTLNNTKIDPFERKIKDEMPINIQKAPDSFFDNSDIVLLNDWKKTLSDSLEAKMTSEQKKDESTGVNGSLLYILAIILISITVFLYQKTNKKLGK